MPHTGELQASDSSRLLTISLHLPPPSRRTPHTCGESKNIYLIEWIKRSRHFLDNQFTCGQSADLSKPLIISGFFAFFDLNPLTRNDLFLQHISLVNFFCYFKHHLLCKIFPTHAIFITPASVKLRILPTTSSYNYIFSYSHWATQFLMAGLGFRHFVFQGPLGRHILQGDRKYE